MIGLAAVIAAATAIGFGAEHRFAAGADDLARRLLQIVLWVLMPYFDGVPRSIFESAFIDGCREYTAGTTERWN